MNHAAYSGTVVKVSPEVKPERDGKVSLWLLLSVDQQSKQDDVLLIVLWDDLAVATHRNVSRGDKVLIECTTHSMDTKTVDERGKAIFKQYTHGHRVEYLTTPLRWQKNKE